MCYYIFIILSLFPVDSNCSCATFLLDNLYTLPNLNLINNCTVPLFFSHICAAVKKCKLHKPKYQQKQRWKAEVSILQELKHENIVSFKPLPEILQLQLNKYNPSNLPLLSMEYCTEGNLRHALKKPHNICGMQEKDVRHVLEDISNALLYLHKRHITHRDVKPENIVLQKSSRRIIYKLIDLGYAKELENSLSLVGTLTYIAPEILENKEYNPSVDYWSFGIVVWEVICGTYPFLPHEAPFRR